MTYDKIVECLCSYDERNPYYDKEYAKTNKEITDIIYDTLMGNNKSPHEVLNLDKVDNQEVSADCGIIRFDYDSISVLINVRSKDNVRPNP